MRAECLGLVHAPNGWGQSGALGVSAAAISSRALVPGSPRALREPSR